MTHTIVRKHKFDAGHRVYGHEGKCQHIHGHEYHLEIECSPVLGLNKLGMVVDFSVVKDVCCKWVDDNLDHGMLLYAEDPLVHIWNLMGLADPGCAFLPLSKIGAQKHYVMAKNPTAENIAEHLFNTFSLLLIGYNVEVVSVTVQETTNCRATYRPTFKLS